MAITENQHYKNLGKRYSLSEAMEQERWYVENDRTGDGLNFQWVNADTKQPVSFSF